MGYFSGIHVNKPLTNISVKYSFNEGIADQLAPSVKVKKRSDVYFIFDNNNLRLDETLRASGTHANEVSYNMSTSSYTLEEHALSQIITDEDRDNADAPLSMDIDVTEGLTEKLKIRREKMVADLAFTTTNWGNSHTIATATGLWSVGGVDPLTDILTASGVILQSGHVRANRAVIGNDVYKDVRMNTATLTRIQYTQRGIITEDILASLWDLDKVFVGRAAYESAAEGDPTQATAVFWEKHILVYYAPKSPQLKTPSAMYNFVINEQYRVKKWREEARGGDMIEVSTLFVPKAVATSAAYCMYHSA